MRNISSYQKYSTSETVNEKREEANFDIKAFFDAVGEKYEDKGKKEPSPKDVLKAAEEANKKKEEEYKDVIDFIMSKDFEPLDVAKENWKKAGFAQTWDEFKGADDAFKKEAILCYIDFNNDLISKSADAKALAKNGKVDLDYVKSTLAKPKESGKK